jgi:hypothetical protein
LERRESGAALDWHIQRAAELAATLLKPVRPAIIDWIRGRPAEDLASELQTHVRWSMSKT